MRRRDWHIFGRSLANILIGQARNTFKSTGQRTCQPTPSPYRNDYEVSACCLLVLRQKTFLRSSSDTLATLHLKQLHLGNVLHLASFFNGLKFRNLRTLVISWLSDLDQISSLLISLTSLTALELRSSDDIRGIVPCAPSLLEVLTIIGSVSRSISFYCRYGFF